MDAQQPTGRSISRRKQAGGSDLLADTLALWQARAARPLSREDAREIVHNLTGFFRVLQEWERAERGAAIPPSSRRE